MESRMPENRVDKKVSIIIPVYNRAATLPRLFASIDRITHRPLEIVLVDNHSADQSLAYCRDFQKKHEGEEDFQVLVGEEHKAGACAARNKGTAMSSSNYLYFFDSDDEMSPEFIEELLPYFPAYDVVCAPTQMWFEEGVKKQRDCVPSAYPYDQILSASLSTQSLMIQKDFMVEIGGWDEDIRRWNDWELGVRILCHQPRLKWLPQKAYHKIHQHRQSISGNTFTKDHQLLLESLRKAERDLYASTLPEDIRYKSLKALTGKYVLLAASIYKEGNAALAEDIYRQGIQKSPSSSFKKIAAGLYGLSKFKLPGIWRIFLRLI